MWKGGLAALLAVGVGTYAYPEPALHLGDYVLSAIARATGHDGGNVFARELALRDSRREVRRELYGDDTPPRPGQASTYAPPHPVSFVPISNGYRDLTIRSRHTIGPGLRLSSQPWPFLAVEAEIACAPPAVNVVKLGERYAAVNGNTSGLARRYRIRDSKGSVHDIIGTSDNADLRKNGLVSPDASDIAINDWRWEMNQKLLRDCG
jgi:hypothetical protein